MALQTSSTIGLTTVGNGNLFHNHQKGIDAFRSSVRSYKNNFYNIRHAAGVPVTSTGDKFCAIYAVNAFAIIGGLANHTVWIGDLASNRNNFLNCEVGISSKKSMNLEAHYNYMKNCSLRGISAEDNRLKTMNIYYNEINSTNPNAWGIYLKNYNFGIANVENNEINLNANSFSGITRFAAGIYTSSISPVINQTTLIKSNTINNCLYGIWMINTSGGTIDQNIINMTNAQINTLANSFAPVRGIVVQNSHKAKIWNNTITRNLGTGNGVSNDNLQGIRLELSPASEVWKNSMTRTAVGFYAFGSNIGARVECNQLNYNRNGFWMQAADISNQGSAPVLGLYPEGISAHNAWTGNFANNSDGTTIGHTSSDPLMYYHKNGSIFNSGPTYDLGVLNFWVDNSLYGNPSTSCGAALNPTPIVLSTPSSDRNRQLLDIVSGIQLYDSIDTQMKHYLKHSALSRLKNEPGLQTLNTPEDSIYQLFVSNLTNSDFDKSINIQEKLASQQYDSAQFILAQLNTSDFQINLNKQVEEIWIQHHLNNTIISETDSLILLDIACLDPIEFGSAVYQARSIIDWDGFCINSQHKSTNQFDQEFHLPSSVKVYPNPAQNNITIESLNEIIELKLYDFKGVEVLKKSCNSKKELIFINLPAGIYMMQIETSEGIILIEKISAL